MSERPTPETDAAWQSDKDTIFRVMTSRRLERERDELIADVHQPELCNEKMLRLEKERDEANYFFKEQSEVVRNLKVALMETAELSRRLKDERNKAMSALMKIEDIANDAFDSPCEDLLRIREISRLNLDERQ